MNIKEKVLLSGEKILIDADTGRMLESIAFKPIAKNSYNDQRAYVNFSIAAANLVAASSGAIVAGASTLLPTAEATFICSVGAVVTATPTTPGAGVKPYVVIGTTTTTGATSIPQSSGSAAVSTFNPSLAVAAGAAYSVGLVGTGTAAATETFGATTLVVGLGPQYV